MPAQKRALDTDTPPPSPPPLLDDEKPGDSLNDAENREQRPTENASGARLDSEDSPYSSDAETEEFIVVKLAEIRKEVQCPICLGIIRKTRTVMECLHRFCRECIDKSMRLGNNECPACRTHCASRRSLRDDPNYDALIAALYPDIDKYEEEELAFHEEEKARNKQIQASIAQTSRRQAEALGKKRTSSRVAAAVRRQDSYRNLRGRRSHRIVERHGSDEEQGVHGNDGSKDSSSADEHSPEVKLKRCKKWGGRTAQKNGGCVDNDSEVNKEMLGASAGVVGCSEILAWGRGGLRSNTRHGGLSWANSKISRNNRFLRLIDHLRTSSETHELKICLTLVSLLEEKIPSLKRPYLCCSSKSSVRHLCQYIAMQTSVEATEIELLMMKDCKKETNPSSLNNNLGVLDPCKYELNLLSEHQTLGEIHSSYSQQNLLVAYRQKAEAKETV